MVIRTYFPLNDALDLAAEMAGWTDTDSAKNGADSEPTVSTWQPLTDISEDSTAYFIRMELPGVKKEDLTLKLEEDHLTIAGRKEFRTDENGRTYLAREIRDGSFEKKFRINGNIQRDKIDAKLVNGLLDVVLPKVEKAKAREIKVEAR